MTVALDDFLQLADADLVRAGELARRLKAIGEERAGIVAELAAMGIVAAPEPAMVEPIYTPGRAVVDGALAITLAGDHEIASALNGGIPRPGGGFYRCGDCGELATIQVNADWFCDVHGDAATMRGSDV